MNFDPYTDAPLGPAEPQHGTGTVSRTVVDRRSDHGDTQELPAHTPNRLRRAWSLVKSGRVKPLGEGRFIVAGNVEPRYFVDLNAEIPCTCRDEEFRGARIHHQCKHRLAARIAAQEPAILLALIGMMDFTEDAA